MKAKPEQEKFIEALYREMYDRLCSYAYNALKDRWLAEEAVQDTFQVACGKLDELFAHPNPKGWLYLTLRRCISNMREHRAVMFNVLVSAPSMDETADSSSPSSEVDTKLLCLQVLGEEDYKLFNLVAFEGLTMLEAAKAVGISVEACKKRIQRARRKLKKLWKF